MATTAKTARITISQTTGTTLLNGVRPRKETQVSDLDPPPERGFAPREAHKQRNGRRSECYAGSVHEEPEMPSARRGLVGEPGVPPRF